MSQHVSTNLCTVLKAVEFLPPQLDKWLAVKGSVAALQSAVKVAVKLTFVQYAPLWGTVERRFFLIISCLC